MLSIRPDNGKSLRVVPPCGRVPPVSDEYAAGSWTTVMHAACPWTDQKPSPSGVCTVGSCHRTGAIARSRANTSCGKPPAKRSRSVRSTSPGILAMRGDVTFLHMPDLEDYKGDFRAYNAAVVDEFRNNRGQVTGMFEHAPLVLITTTGAKSGTRRTTPLVHTTDGDKVVIIASKGGAPTSPDWFHNLVANPDVTVELPNETFEARARVAQGDERERLW